MTESKRVAIHARTSARLLVSSALLAATVTIVPRAWAVEPDIPQTLVTEADALAVLIRQKASEKATGATSAADDRQALASFYAERGGKPVWIDAQGLNARAKDVSAEIRNANDWGLQASAFDLPDTSPGASPDAQATTELKLSLAVMKYARHARGGRFNPSDLTKNLDVSPQLYDPKSVLTSIATTDGPATYLRGLHPKHPQFEKLRQAYLAARGGGRVEPEAPARQEALAESPAAESGVVIPPGPRLEREQRHPHVRLLRERLGVPAKDDPSHFDEQLAEALEDFQNANGLRPDGALTSTTRMALNRGAEGRGGRSTARTAERAVPERVNANAAKLLANMERWRYVPDDLGKLHIWINVPEFMVRVVKDGKVIHAERIVAGKTDTQTAIFSAPMQEVIFNPSWNVPMSIKVKEIQPHLSQSPAILAKQNLRIKVGNRDIDPSSVDWASADMKNFHFYQPPGAHNVLGIVKFAFPNKHDIYMHDTPSKNLFNSDVRLFSHGRMRVRDPKRLAEVLLREDKGWDAARVNSMIGGAEENRIGLSQKIPVHVTYFTAFYDDAGKLVSKPDHYGHDQRITDALNGKPIAQIAQNDPAAAQARSVQEARATLQSRRVQRRERDDDGGGNGNFLSWLLN